MFSLGLDGHHLLSLHTIAQRAELFDALLSLYRTMVALPIPIIANINVCCRLSIEPLGPAIG